MPKHRKTAGRGLGVLVRSGEQSNINSRLQHCVAKEVLMCMARKDDSLTVGMHPRECDSSCIHTQLKCQNNGHVDEDMLNKIIHRLRP